MYDDATMVYLIERALDVQPWCRACGAPTTIGVREGGFWLVCTGSGRPPGLRARVAAALLPHDRRLIVRIAGDPVA
jgi:hypothetical protein